ncbi:MAG: hypothetical protein MJZ99_07895 [Bacteroidales bacterium]|nr:hypothetical protein [Bacteroidales bacterium]
MILKPIAKPVRIRIKSGGMEHSSVESLKSHFVVDDIKDLVADGRLSRWLEQQNHRSIPNEILALNKDSMEFALAVYRFFFDEKNAMSDGEVYYYLYQETNNDDFLNKSAEEHFPKALIELDERREKAVEEAKKIRADEESRRKAEEEARKKTEEYILIGENQFVELSDDFGFQSKLDTDFSKFDKPSSRILTFAEWNYLVGHLNHNHPFYKKYFEPYLGKNLYFVYKVWGHGSYGICVGSVYRNKIQFGQSDRPRGTLLLFNDVEK